MYEFLFPLKFLSFVFSSMVLNIFFKIGLLIFNLSELTKAESKSIAEDLSFSKSKVCKHVFCNVF